MIIPHIDIYFALYCSSKFMLYMTRYFSIILMVFVLGCGSKRLYLIQTGANTLYGKMQQCIFYLQTDSLMVRKNDFVHPSPPAPYRGYMGGDIKGITLKINEGYFDKLGVDAIWMTPLVENISVGVDEGSGLSYGFHGYWTKDWTKIDARLGTEQDIKTW